MKKNISIQIVLYIILIAFAVLFTMPMIYLISTSLKPNGALYEYPPKFFPTIKSITLENYVYIINQGKFYINFLNSVLVSTLTVAIAAVVASALGFCIGRFQFFGRNVLFAFIILTMIVPGMTLIVPQYQLAVKMNVINKLLGLVPFYVAWVIPYSTFMIKGFVENIPREFDEAVHMDGGSILTVFFQIILPLAKPGIASISIFNFLTAWEEFPWANTVINDNVKRTLPIAISGFFGQHQFTQWGYVFALSALSLIPILIVFISYQKYFVTGITTGGVKG
jgi:multiple sugar transport system permease protein